MLLSLVRVGVCRGGVEGPKKESKSKSARTFMLSGGLKNMSLSSRPRADGGGRGSCCGLRVVKNGSCQAARCRSRWGCCGPVVSLEPESMGKVREAFPGDRRDTLFHGE